MKYLKVGTGILLLVAMLIVNNILNRSLEVTSTDKYLTCTEAYLTYKNDGMNQIVKKDGKNYLVQYGLTNKTIYSQSIEENGDGTYEVSYDASKNPNNEYLQSFTVNDKSDIPELKLPYKLDNEVMYQIRDYDNGYFGPIQIDPLVATSNLCKKE